MTIQHTLTNHIKEAFRVLYNKNLITVEFQITPKEFEGDITVVVFPMLRLVKINPERLGQQLGENLKEKSDYVIEFNIVKGFLNLVISNQYYLDFFNSIKNREHYGFVKINPDLGARIVEYSSPNTNKPLHLGHLRNIVLGYSISKIIEASGKKVYKTQIINDRGIHICKSMLAWLRYGNSETPEYAKLKGDKLVGNYYVRFNKEYKVEINQLIEEGLTEEEAKAKAPILIEAQNMLRQWEAGDKDVVTLWKTMNQWVYDGFEQTYKNLGVDFDSYYYESQTYLLGKEFITQGLKNKVFYKKPDGSVWCNLSADGLDEKIVLRADGTAVYITQDIGTAIQRIKDYPNADSMVYTVGNEQDYHFKVLFLILKKLGFSWANQLQHLSYGMVDLPSGKMKSREGTVVDADELLMEMTETAKNISKDLGKLEDFSEQKKLNTYKIIGLGALKYFILKVDPKKRILFNPKASIDFQGNTGPFIQYAYARIQAILRKADFDISQSVDIKIHQKEKDIIKQLQLFPETIQQAAEQLSPALIANYIYDLVKLYNSFFQNVSIFKATSHNKKVFRVQLSKSVGQTIKNAFALLGIDVPERM